jgi:hypothetical protein
MTTDERSTAETVPTRRCWRCLQSFACAADDLPAGPAQWWLCEACHLALIGPAR